jgi:sterol desaturase/sphingolipid hydroxylase (fatty acid hydroxylase superfamily)
LFLPFAVKAVHTNLLGGHEADNWCLHMLGVSLLRYVHGQAWMSLSRSHWLTGKYRIQTKGISFDQVDRESAWDDYILLHVVVATLVHAVLPGFSNFPTFWDSRGILILLLVHMGPTEYIYYWLHRALHHHVLYNKYHSHHHASFITEPVSGMNLTSSWRLFFPTFGILLSNRLQII